MSKGQQPAKLEYHAATKDYRWSIALADGRRVTYWYSKPVTRDTAAANLRTWRSLRRRRGE
jgi:hypothetical protein